MSDKEWGEAHRGQARARLYQLAASAVLDGVDWATAGDIANSGGAIGERHFRDTLRVYADFDVARINREVRHVRALAEGRMVRETVVRFYVSQPGILDEDFGTLGGAKLAASQRVGARAVRACVTRIRKA